MPSDGTSRWQRAFQLLVLVVVVVPLVTRWVTAGADVLGSLDVGLLDFGLVDVGLFDVASLDSATAVRAVGLGVVVLVTLLLVRQKRRSRGQRASEDAPEEDSDRRVEGSGEVYAPYAYNNQQAARRESERIRNRAEEIAEAERDAYQRR